MDICIVKPPCLPLEQVASVPHTVCRRHGNLLTFVPLLDSHTNAREQKEKFKLNSENIFITFFKLHVCLLAALILSIIFLLYFNALWNILSLSLQRKKEKWIQREERERELADKLVQIFFCLFGILSTQWFTEYFPAPIVVCRNITHTQCWRCIEIARRIQARKQKQWSQAI